MATADVHQPTESNGNRRVTPMCKSARLLDEHLGIRIHGQQIRRIGESCGVFDIGESIFLGAA